ncbi:hypothetical protein GCM10009625_19090 [Brachybacterium fresconis]
MDWWVVLYGLFALLLSLPLSEWIWSRFEWIPGLLFLWAVTVPTLAMAGAIAWFLLRVPPPRWDLGSALATVVMAPLLLVVGIIGNVLTLGLGIPCAAIFVVSEAKTARQQAATSERSRPRGAS